MQPAGLRDPTLTTRQQAARRIGCSYPTVIKLEQEGLLTPVRDGKRVFLRVADVERARTQWRPQRARRITQEKGISVYRGKVAVDVFPMFKRGETFEDIVIASGADPLLIRELYREWKTSLDDGEKRREENKLARDEFFKQRRHDNETRVREWRKWKLEYAKVLARGGDVSRLGPEPARAEEKKTA